MKSSKLIKQKLDIMDIKSIVDEFQKVSAEVLKNKAKIEAEGAPTVLIRIVGMLVEAFIDGKIKLDPKKKKELSKQINQLKKQIQEIYHIVKDEIDEAKKSGDYYKEEVEETKEEVVVPGQPEENVLQQQDDTSSEESEAEAVETDFAGRLALSLEDRRRFWLIHEKEKKQAKKKRRQRPKHLKQSKLIAANLSLV